MTVSIWSIITITIAVPSIPLYLFLIISLIIKSKRKQFKSCYYTLVISQGITDIMAMNSQLLFEVAVQFEAIADIIWSFRASRLAAWSYLHLYIFVLARMIGIFMFCIQRYLSICRPTGYINRLVNSIPGICFCLLHGTLSVLLAFPVLYQTRGMEFQDNSLVLVQTDAFLAQAETNLTYTTALLIGFYIASFSIFCRAGFAFTAFKAKKSVRMQENVQLIHVASLLFELIITVIYFLITAIVQVSSIPIEVSQEEYSVFSALLSYPTPWLLPIINKDVRNLFLKTKIKEAKSNPASIS